MFSNLRENYKSWMLPTVIATLFVGAFIWERGYQKGFNKAELENKMDTCVNARMFQVCKHFRDKCGDCSDELGGKLSRWDIVQKLYKLSLDETSEMYQRDFM